MHIAVYHINCVFVDAVYLQDFVTSAIEEGMIIEHWFPILIGETRSSQRKYSRPSAIVPITNTTWTGLILNQEPSIKRVEDSLLSSGTPKLWYRAVFPNLCETAAR
jgi:hypothetical protein